MTCPCIRLWQNNLHTAVLLGRRRVPLVTFGVGGMMLALIPLWLSRCEHRRNTGWLCRGFSRVTEAPLAQLDRAPVYGTGGCRFESRAA